MRALRARRIAFVRSTIVVRAVALAAVMAALVLGSLLLGVGARPATDTVFGLPDFVGVGHTATLLRDGRVLIVGGVSPPLPLPSTGRPPPSAAATYPRDAVLFDPWTGRVTRPGPMVEGRWHHAATLLADGRVLITGGARFGDAEPGGLDTAELFDPSTSEFTPVDTMTVERWMHSAILLSDGTVLVVGGRRDEYSRTSAADIFDPTDGTFTAVGWVHSLPFSLNLIVSRGADVLAIEAEQVERFDLATRRFEFMLSLPEGAQGGTAVALADGRVLVTGGLAPEPASAPGVASDGSPRTMPSREASAAAFIIDPVSGGVSRAAELRTARWGHSATRLSDGRVLIVGGLSGFPPFDRDRPLETGEALGGYMLTSVELYAPAAEAVRPARWPAALALVYSVTALPDGSALLIGLTSDGPGTGSVAVLYWP